MFFCAVRNFLLSISYGTFKVGYSNDLMSAMLSGDPVSLNHITYNNRRIQAKAKMKKKRTVIVLVDVLNVISYPSIRLNRFNKRPYPGVKNYD